MKHARTLAWNPLDYIRAMFNPYVAFGVALLVLWLLTRMTLLSWADLSFILPMTGVGYILAAILGAWLLKEPVSAARWMGVLLIFAGTSLVAATSQKTESRE